MSWEIDPKKTGPENLWSAIQYCTVRILGRKKLRLTKEERDELTQECLSRSYQHFMKYKLPHYNRNYTFIQNVYSSCLGTSGWVTDQFIRRIKDRLDMEQLDNNGNYVTMEYVSTYEARRLRARKGTAPRRCSEDDWLDYLEDCETLGLTAMTREQFNERQELLQSSI